MIKKKEKSYLILSFVGKYGVGNNIILEMFMYRILYKIDEN